AAAPRELWLGIEGIDVAYAAVHEEIDDALRSGRERRSLGRQWIVVGGLEDARESGKAETRAASGEEFTACHASSVAHALLRAASRLFSTPGRPVRMHRNKSRCGTQECVRHGLIGSIDI